MKISILTIFPEMFLSPFSESIIKRALQKKLVNISIIDIRSFTKDKHRSVDDYSYGGGPGMVLKPGPIVEAIESIKAKKNKQTSGKIILTSAQGKVFNQDMAKKLLEEKEIIFICGRYEGIDERVRHILKAEEVSIGDYVTTGGEIPVMVMVDVLVRMIPGVLGKEESMVNDSFYNGLLDYPHFTRPEKYMGYEVPDILLSGDHEKIDKWRKKQSLIETIKKRPDLLINRKFTKEEIRILNELKTDKNEKKGKQ
ncbi:MAG: tRNA (guanosine(37)-N1)-methyltransferase TrmD [Candidatus Caldatribacteriota bacterium]|jgi:tRNA (guanine37-N1)-methyltransferase|nr:tRNA (guanosine(37)-N1)-methyltransferase TrmD [Atribacterota bacterium]MDD3640199.1 tRNA (guanosine(37)-N1)-methyltransferase TrmD [Atribacterota bacterium]MDD4288527.1 tRNA (guanosine(37)-N1)-methyltransferase TrmD [Atribacterota bacterium]MDD4764705.1 tRNA (guanosine(37)-N1)-methyltransferase TrmD [Atribacterota bacterium]